MVSKVRAERIAERIREELSQMLILEVSDPRLSGIYITDVQVDRELAYATIFVSAVEGSERWTEIHAGLNHATGFLRRELSQRIDLRTFPRLRFNWDPTYERAENIERLFKELEDEAREKSETENRADADNSEEDQDDLV